MKYGALWGGVVGIGLSIWLLDSFGVVRIVQLLATAGWLGIASLIAFHGVQILFSAAGWREIAAADGRARLSTYYLLRWIREGVNNLLPLAQVGGELIVVRLLRRRGIALAPAVAGTLADLAMEVSSQIAFTVFGLVLLLSSLGNAGIARYVVAGVTVAGLAMTGFFGALHWGFGEAVERGLVRLGRMLGWPGAGAVEGLNASLLRCFAAPGRAALSFLWHLVSWLLGGAEVCLALHFLGHDVGLREGLVIESIGQALKTAGFAVPGALGIQEGGYIIVCRLYGLAPDVAIAMSLLKRLREVALGIPALVVWQRDQRRTAAVDVTSVSGVGP